MKRKLFHTTTTELGKKIANAIEREKTRQKKQSLDENDISRITRNVINELRNGGGLDVCLIGSFVCELEEDGQLPIVAEMGEIGKFKKEILFDVVVRRKDGGNIPHVHIWDSNTDGKEFDACVQLTQNKYFDHGYHTDILNSRQRKAFKIFMDSIHEDNITKYVYAVKEWNQNNSNMMIDIEKLEKESVTVRIVTPDYRNLTGYKEY